MTLHDIKDKLQQMNPEARYRIDATALFVRAHDGRWFGLYSETIGGGIACTIRDGCTVLPVMVDGPDGRLIYDPTGPYVGQARP